MSTLPFQMRNFDSYANVLGAPAAPPIYSGPLSTPQVAPLQLEAPDMGAGGIFGTGMNGFQLTGAAIGGLQALGSLWMASKQMKLAKKQFKFNKDITNTNLNNQMQSYNTALADRARSRGVMEGQTPDQVSEYIRNNSLSRAQGRDNGYSVGAVSDAALNNYSSYLGRGTSGYTGPVGSSSSSSSPAPTASAASAATRSSGDRNRDDKTRG